MNKSLEEQLAKASDLEVAELSIRMRFANRLDSFYHNAPKLFDEDELFLLRRSAMSVTSLHRAKLQSLESGRPLR